LAEQHIGLTFASDIRSRKSNRPQIGWYIATLRAMIDIRKRLHAVTGIMLVDSP
jgi:hypothetical protein